MLQLDPIERFPVTIPAIVSRSLPTAYSIRQLVCGNYGITISDMDSSSRSRSLVEARHIAMWFIRERLGTSLPELGRLFGGRDHTTVIAALRHVERMRNHPVWKARMEDVTERLRT
jgi:chromosomal replication initiator protein